jgi:alkylhydroperoxidase family enzyme
VSRIAPLEPPYAGEIQEQFDRVMHGAPPLMLFRVLAGSARAWEKFRAGSLLDRGPLTLREREIVIDRTCALTGCEYEWGVHVALFGERVRFGEAEIAAIVHGPASAACWAVDEQALIALVDDLVDHRTIADATWQAASQHFDEAQLIEAIAITGFYHTISFLCRGLKLPLESYGARFPSV